MVRALRPKNLGEALKALDKERVIVLAGGTDLMVSRKRWSGLTPLFEKPVLFIDHLDALKGVESDGNCVKIGSACTFTSLLENGEIPGFFKDVLSQIASPAIRNIATIGGNICNASPAGDTLPILYALNASLVLAAVGSSRTIAIDNFITGPGETVINENELVKEIVIPKDEFNVFFYKKVGARRANSCSKLSFTGLARVVKGKIGDIRIAFGAVSPTVVRSREIEQKMKNKSVSDIEKMLPEWSNSYSLILDPIDDQRCNRRYRKKISLRILEHFLRSLN